MNAPPTQTFGLNPEDRGWLRGVRQMASANWDARPEPMEVDLIVLHGISLPPGDFDTRWIEALFTNTLDPDAHPYFKGIADLCVSAHFLVDRKGNVTQFVPLHGRAWHAGESCFAGRPRCNDFSLGIELVGADTVPYTPPQYETCARLVRALSEYFPIPTDHVVGHCDIAPGRKTDPGPSFDWHYLRQRLAAHAANRS